MINNTTSVALSGMKAAQTRLDASAHNVANVQTDNFRRHEVTQEAQAAGGTTAIVRQAAAPGEALPRDLVEQISAGYSFVANLKVIKTQQQMSGALLDRKA